MRLHQELAPPLPAGRPPSLGLRSSSSSSLVDLRHAALHRRERHPDNSASGNNTSAADDSRSDEGQEHPRPE